MSEEDEELVSNLEELVSLQIVLGYSKLLSGEDMIDQDSFSRQRKALDRLARIWGESLTEPSSLKAMVDQHPARVLVHVRCADHKKTLVAAVFRTPPNEFLLVTSNEDVEPLSRSELPGSAGTASEGGDLAAPWSSVAADLTAPLSAALAAVWKPTMAWKPTPTLLGEEAQPEIWCPRCRAPRPVGDLLAIATKASKTHPAHIHA